MAQGTQVQGEGLGVNSRATLFGAPVGDFGWFASFLIGAASGFIVFFLTTFVGIVGIMIYNSAAHGNVDYSLSYLRGGLPLGSITMLAAWAYLGRLWVARISGK